MRTENDNEAGPPQLLVVTCNLFNSFGLLKASLGQFFISHSRGQYEVKI
jgi:hypothetical protein